MRKFLLLTLLAALIFVPSVPLRAPTFGKFYGDLKNTLGQSDWTSLTSLSLIGTRYWYEVGPFAARFRFSFTEPSLENAIHFDFYHSSFSTHLVPPYLLSLLRNRPPDHALLMGLSLAWHFFLLFAVLGMTACFLRREDRFVAACLVLSAGLLVTYEYEALIFFQTVWWPDLVVVPMLAGMLWLDALQEENRSKRLELFFQVGLFVCMLVDWLALVFGVAWVIRRFFERRSWKRLLPQFAVLAMIYLFYIGLGSDVPGDIWEPTWAKILERSGMDGLEGFSYFGFFPAVVRTYLIGIDHSIDFWILVFGLFGSMLVWALEWHRKRSGEAGGWWQAKIAALTWLALLGHFALFPEHYYHHTYTRIKFVLAFAFLPWVAWRLFCRFSLTARRALAALLLLLSLEYTYDSGAEYLRHRDRILSPGFALNYERAQFLRANTRFDDVVFVEQPLLEAFGIANNGDDIRAFANKASYFAADPVAMNLRLRDLQAATMGAMRIPHFLLLTDGPPSSPWLTTLGALRARSGTWELWTIRDAAVVPWRQAGVSRVKIP